MRSSQSNPTDPTYLYTDPDNNVWEFRYDVPQLSDEAEHFEFRQVFANNMPEAEWHEWPRNIPAPPQEVFDHFFG